MYNENIREGNQMSSKVVLKRSGVQAAYEPIKIKKAIQKANAEMSWPQDQLTEEEIEKIVEAVSAKVYSINRAFSVEEIQDMVENGLIMVGKAQVAKAYITYRYRHNEKRALTGIDKKIQGIIELESGESGVQVKNEEVKQENSNKNPTILSVQRDYMAGEWSRYYTNKYLLPEAITRAHEEGIIHFHDADYFAQHMHNCDLINLEDMLQNGTAISGTHIDKPKSFSTACTVTSQIVAQVASSQYGGQTFTLSHLAPFVDISRKKIAERLQKELADIETTLDQDKFNRLVEAEVRKEVSSGCQTIQYQLITLQSTNGQAPFVTVFMYLHEVPEGQTREDLAMIIEEMLKQRILGVKDVSGHYITPAFPKLIYVLQDDNIDPGTKYYYLTQLAAECTAKRMVPDYISEKIMKELKGDVYPCMGCVEKSEIVTYKLNGFTYVEAFARMWNRLSKLFTVKEQLAKGNYYMDLTGVQIFDTVDGFVDCKRIIQNKNVSNWVRVTLDNGRVLTCTDDHPFDTNNRGRVYAKDLIASEDKVLVHYSQVTSDKVKLSKEKAWLYGAALWNSALSKGVVLSFNVDSAASDFCKEILTSEYNSAVSGSTIEEDPKGNWKKLNLKLVRASKLQYELISSYGGVIKNERHIPTAIFNSDADVRMSFLGGLMDNDGIIRRRDKKCYFFSGNKEIMLQTAALIQSLGMPAYVAFNDGRYSVSFIPNKAIARYMHDENKARQIEELMPGTTPVSNIGTVVKVEPLMETMDSYDVTTESDHFEVSGIYSHNCRSFLTPDRFTDAGVENIANAMNYEPGKHRYYGRFNQGVVTLNLVDIACSSNGDEEKFWEIMNDRLELCHEALRLRHERLLGTPSDVAPILWQDGAIARLQPGETIDRLLFDGYSTISLGYAGLYECVYYMKHESHTTEDGKEFGLRVMQKLNDACNEWKKAENIDYSVYGTPLESTTYKFAKSLQKRFGIIPEVTDHNYITNSYHINVREDIDAFSKLSKEADFQKLSPGGAISYVEVPNLQNNIPAVLAVMKHIYNTILYAELNTKADYCDVCGYNGEIQIVTDNNGKLIWECPVCGNRDQTKMHVARRTCGYIGTNYWNQGRTSEIKDRVLHL